MKKIAIIGECMIELNGKPFGDMVQTFGGDSLNTAVYLARCATEQIDIHYVSALGVDPLSEGMIQRWNEEGIDTQYVLRDAIRQPGLYLIQLDSRGERTFLYWRNQSAARYMVQHAEFPRIASALEQMDMIYLSGISLAILPAKDRAILMALLEKLALRGVEIAFDSNYRPALWAVEGGEKIVQETYNQLLSFCHLALVTFDDEQAIWRDKSPEETLSRLKRSGVKQAVVKLGADGCIYQNFSASDTQLEHIHTTPAKDVIDTTSAGDSFNAGFLSGYLTELSPLESAHRGHQLAGVVIQNRGAIVPALATQPITNQFKSINRALS